jgi:hypothetical protein
VGQIKEARYLIKANLTHNRFKNSEKNLLDVTKAKQRLEQRMLLVSNHQQAQSLETTRNISSLEHDKN